MNQKTQKTLFSSKSDEWETGKDFFNGLKQYWDFDLDPCATDSNHKCIKYYTSQDDGLSKDWGQHVSFMNPPYSEVKKWIKKAHQESLKEYTTVVCLIPSRTETINFKYCWDNATSLYFIQGRLTFDNINNVKKSPAPFPSMLVVFEGKRESNIKINLMDRQGNIL